MAENKNTMEVNKTEATEVAEVKEKKPLVTKVKEGATKVWNVVKTPLAIGGALLLGAGIALAGAQYERTMNEGYEPEEPEFDPEPVEGEYKEVPESE